MPNVVEVFSLLSPNDVQAASRLASAGFTNLPLDASWTCTTWAGDSGNPFASEPTDAHAPYLAGSVPRVAKT